MKTKAILSILLLMKCFSLMGQITLEATYDSASTNLYMVTLEVEGDKYVKVQRGDSAHRFIRFYDLNHSLWKTIDVNPMPIYRFFPPPMNTTLNTGRFIYDVLYISEHLFDADDQIEYMYVVQTGLCPQFFTGIYNEDGSAVFTQDSAVPNERLNIPIVAKPIYNSSAGTKMILSFPCTKQAKVYSLTGVLTNSQISLNGGGEESSLSTYPNPAVQRVTIDYSLPADAEQGEIVIYDMSGGELKRYQVDHTFNNLMLDGNELPAGTYLCTLIANGQVLKTNQIVFAQ